MLIILPPRRRARGTRPRALGRRTSSCSSSRPDCERVRRQLVQETCRLGRRDDDALAVPHVPDLRRLDVPDQVGGRSLTDDHAVAEHRDAIGELLRLVEVVRREQDRRAERPERADQLPRGAARGRVEARGRLVEEDELRVPDERDAEVETTLLPSRERLDAGVPLLAEADELDHLVDVARVGEVAGEEAVRLADGQERAQLRLLQDDPHPLSEPSRRLAGIEAEHRGVAAVAPAVALEDLDGRRLARAVRPEEPEDLALGDVEAHTAERLGRHRRTS